MGKKFSKFLSLAIFTSVIILLISCIKYIFFGSVNWDEPIQLLGIDEHLKFALSSLKAEGRSYKEIVTNMEWYGVALKLIYALPMLILKNLFNQDNKLLLFASLRGFALLIYFASGVIFYYTSNFYQRRKSKILILIYFTFPLLAGESYLNITDIPFAIFFSLYSLLNGMILLRFQNKLDINKSIKISDKGKYSFWKDEKTILFFSIFAAALLINSKASILASILFIESFLAFCLIDRKGSFLEITKNFFNKLKPRIISIFALTYLISPAAWISPFKYYAEVISAFSKFFGIYGSRIGGVELRTNTDSWNLFEYLWRWFLIKIPLIMIFLILFFIIVVIYDLIKNRKNRSVFIFTNPVLTFYLLQLIVTPSLAIFANSSSYNALRHWCFMYPPLIIFSAYVVDNYLINSNSKLLNDISKLFVAVFTALGITDNVLMMPYSNLSFNIYGRQFVKEENTDIDYWGYSAGELLKSKVIDSYEVRSFTSSFITNEEHSTHHPHHIKSENHKNPYALASNTRGHFKKIDKECKDIDFVSRNLLFRKEPLVFSKIGVCPLFIGENWKIWTNVQGQIEIESVNNKKLRILPKKYSPLDLKRVKDDGNLLLVFLKNQIFTIEKFTFDEIIKKETLKLKANQEISSFIDSSYQIPKSKTFKNRKEFISEWELGFEVPDAKAKSFYKDEFVELFNLDTNNLGLVCKIKNKRDFRVILKDKSGEWIYKPNGKSGDFIIKKVECISDQNGNIQKIFLYDSNGQTTYKWEIDLNGTVIESKQVKTTTSKIQRNYKSEWEMGIDNAEIKPEPFFKNEKIELVSIDKNYVGIICKIKNKKDFRILLKDKSGNLIFKPNGKSGDFSIKKGDCVFNESSKLESVFLYDSNGDVTYRWEINLKGYLVNSEQI